MIEQAKNLGLVGVKASLFLDSLDDEAVFMGDRVMVRLPRKEWETLGRPTQLGADLRGIR